MKTISTTIKGTYKGLAGSLNWLRNEIENSEFYFSSTTYERPCVCWRRFRTDKDGNKKVEYSKLVAYITNDGCDDPSFREYGDNCCIAYSNGEYCDGLFRYLTPAAAAKCVEFIKQLADALKETVENDKGDFEINVSVTEK